MKWQKWQELRHNPQFIGGLIGVILLILTGIAIFIVHDIAENRRIDAEAVTFKPDLTINYGLEAKASDFIENLNGHYLTNPDIDTNELGEVTVEFEYLNIKNRKRTRKFTIEVVDRTAPLIYGRNFYAVERGYTGDLTNLILSGDDLDDHPAREVTGKYDLDTVGDYEVEYIITDASGNQSKLPFTLRVFEPSPSSPGSDSAVDLTETLPISTVIAQHKTDQTKIGIDVSSWQGEIDWSKVQAAGVEFAFIRLGYQVDYGGEYVIDKYFQRNIEQATAAGLPVGVYFYSYANSPDEAKQQAEWVKAQIAPYKVELGVAFDWENWSDFNHAGMSLRTINRVAKTFLDTLTESGYKGFLYGSKNYLERIWQPSEHSVWVAQYYDYVTYTGKYQIWQMSDSGRVPGISGNVDLDIMYLE